MEKAEFAFSIIDVKLDLSRLKLRVVLGSVRRPSGIVQELAIVTVAV